MVLLKRNAQSQKVAYETLFSAGFDLQSQIEHTLLPGERAVIPTGLFLDGVVTPHQFIHILPRSSLAVKYGVDVLAGVVDVDYREEIKVVLINHGKEPFHIKIGDRIAQAVVQRIDRMPYVTVKSTQRKGGFGSTDKKEE